MSSLECTAIACRERATPRYDLVGERIEPAALEPDPLGRRKPLAAQDAVAFSAVLNGGTKLGEALQRDHGVSISRNSRGLGAAFSSRKARK